MSSHEIKTDERLKYGLKNVTIDLFSHFSCAQKTDENVKNGNVFFTHKKDETEYFFKDYSKRNNCRKNTCICYNFLVLWTSLL